MMLTVVLVSTDRQAHEVAADIRALDAALSSEQTLKAIVSGLPGRVVEGVRRSLATERRELVEALEGYERAKTGDAALLIKRAGADPGALLIAFRIVQRLSQKELARKLGLREQQIQRYEAERYRSITLAGYQKVAGVLGARLKVDMETQGWTFSYGSMPSIEELTKVRRHARANGWLEGGASDEKAESQLVRYVADHVLRHGRPSLLRAGMHAVDLPNDWTLLSWKAQVTRVAERMIAQYRPVYRPVDVSWLLDLVKLSRSDDGPASAVHLLRKHGVVLVIEPHITGMKVDGAAFLVDGVPVIGLTLLRDTLDNFWFTLLHEVAHVVLHYRTGLSAGFFDDMTSNEVDEIENEANEFARNVFIPDELWSRSPARISNSNGPIEKLAHHLGIHPAIVFGRVRMERDDYSLFSDKLGRGLVRRQLLSSRQGA